MKKRIAILTVLVLLTLGGASAQANLPVFDATNFANAVMRFIQLQQQLAQLITTYKQIVLEYEHMIRQAKLLPGLARHQFLDTPWRNSRAADTYGTSGDWSKAINYALDIYGGYSRATERLLTYGAALARIPPDQIDRARTDYASVELEDAANLHGIEVIGLQRAKAAQNQAVLDALESATLSTSSDDNTQIAVLNKINATNMMALRAGQDTNQLLVSLLEQTLTEAKARRDAEAYAINANISLRQNAFSAGMEGVRGTTDAITSFRMR
jgi:conjugal transfer/entry exclusion protein